MPPIFDLVLDRSQVVYDPRAMLGLSFRKGYSKSEEPDMCFADRLLRQATATLVDVDSDARMVRKRVDAGSWVTQSAQTLSDVCRIQCRKIELALSHLAVIPRRVEDGG